MDGDEDQRAVELLRYHTYQAQPNRLQAPEQPDLIDQKLQTLSLSFQDTDTLGAKSTSWTSHRDSTLIALCQFAATRLDAQVVGISLLGGHQQHVLADSTQTLESDGLTADDVVDDAFRQEIAQQDWFYNLCRRTVWVQAEDDASVPVYGVPDFAEDAELTTLSSMNNAPNLRSFWGTPIRTAKLYKIGALWMLDNKVRQVLKVDQLRFLGTMTTLVMQNLETRKESVERAKVLKMAKAINHFIDGYQIEQEATDHNFPSSKAPRKEHRHNSTPGLSPRQDQVPPHNLEDFPIMTTSTPEDALDVEATRGAKTIVSKANTATNEENIDSKDRRDRDLVYARASYLIREGLAMQGCLFFDASTGLLARGHDAERRGSRSKRAHVVRTGSHNVLGDPADQRAREQQARPSRHHLLAAPESRTNVHSVPNADILGFALGSSSSLQGDRPEMIDGFPFLEEDFLLQLTRKYPTGTLWLYREDGSLSTSTDETAETNRTVSGSASLNKKHDYAHRIGEAAMLQHALPQVRQILFVPLFEAELSRATAGCFAFTMDSARILPAEAELGFIKSFVNSVGAQVARINAIAADQSKNAFIGSVSHELRSPLHGILAAAEFLEDTTMDTYQKSLIHTQVSCGKTLLQVIEHVLDYSKINSFEKDEQAASQQGVTTPSDKIQFGSKMQNLYANTDVAELCEEVIEGSVAGKSHMRSDIAVTGSSAEDFFRPDQGEGLSKPKAHEDTTFGFNKNVAVILDVDYQKDWTYVTQPGALRRILMNVLGNALKYTASGCIRIRLGVQNFDDPIGELSSIMFLSVSDTGRGISHEFLRKKLFSPFSQEDHLSTGCGLGLSIVKSLVNSLKGNLEVQSEQGVGTTVSIEVPLSRIEPDRAAMSPSSTLKPAQAEGLSLPDEKLSVGFIGFQSDGQVRSPAFEGRDGAIKQNVMKSVANCMVDWLQMEPFPESDTKFHEADYVVILVDERITEFIQPYVDGVREQQPRVIALLASEMSRREVENVLGQSIHAFEVMSAPFGPRKMARAVAACEKAAANWQGHYRRPPPSTTLDMLKMIQSDLDVGSYLLERNGLVVRPKTNINYASQRVQSTDATLLADKPQQKEQPWEAGKESPKPVSPSTKSPTSSPYKQRNSRLLLVDDNSVNLRLLETYMRKRKHDYTCAENGLIAVEAFKEAQQEKDQGHGYGIIFMDISMPVMDGLEATRKIRELERNQREQYERKEANSDTISNRSHNSIDSENQHENEGEKEKEKEIFSAPPAALIVALTGLANSQDQANAFASGVDLFMTKPVKFKEIGRLLDNWFSERDVQT